MSAYSKNANLEGPNLGHSAIFDALVQQPLYDSYELALSSHHEVCIFCVRIWMYQTFIEILAWVSILQ